MAREGFDQVVDATHPYASASDPKHPAGPAAGPARPTCGWLRAMSPPPQDGCL